MVVGAQEHDVGVDANLIKYIFKYYVKLNYVNLYDKIMFRFKNINNPSIKIKNSGKSI